MNVLCFISFFILTALVQIKAEGNDKAATNHKSAGKIIILKKHYLNNRWLNLLHYKKNLFGGWKSQADNNGFFKSKRGRQSPKLELQASLLAYRSTKLHKKSKPHFRCQFPARSHYIETSFPDLKQKKIHCPEFEGFKNKINANAVSLVFSAYHLNSAASAYGHTFLKLSKQKKTEERGSDLLDYGINYAANVTTKNPILYPIFGLVGFFKGTFTAIPYYYKIREYNDYESRDLWEYNLNISEENINWLVEHIFELGSAHFDYYFLTENCSYHMLTLLDAAIPNLRLSDKASKFVIPVETIKVIHKAKGLVKEVNFRPSISSIFERRLSELEDKEKNLLKKIYNKKQLGLIDSSDINSQVKTLDAAIDLFDVLNPDFNLRPTSEQKEWRYKIVSARAGIDKITKPIVIAPPKRKRPHLSHPPRRLGVNYSNFLYDSTDLTYRFAFHDPLDPDLGLPRNMAIEMLKIRLRYDQKERKLRLGQLDLFNLETLIPRNTFVKEMSFRGKVSIIEQNDEDCTMCNLFNVDLSKGLAWSLQEEDKHVFYTLAGGRGFYGNQIKSNFRLELGASLGFINNWSFLKTRFETYYYQKLFSVYSNVYGMKAGIRYSITPKFSIDAEIFSDSINKEYVRSGVYVYF